MLYSLTLSKRGSSVKDARLRCAIVGNIERFFFFGTLMDLDVLEIVLGRKLRAQRLHPARLEGFHAYMAHDEDVPVLVSASGSSVGGVVIDELSADDQTRIAFFEDSEYSYEVRPVIVNDVVSVQAKVHVQSCLIANQERDWHYVSWRQSEKPLFLILARQWMRHLGVADLTEANAEWDRTRARYRAGMATKIPRSR